VLFSEEDLTRFLDVMLRTFDQLNYRQEQRFHLELGLLKLVHLQRLLPMEQFLSQLPASGRGTPGGGALPSGSGGRTARAPAAASAPAPAVPFSPFESDRSRKLDDAPSKPESRGSAATSTPEPASKSRMPTPLEAASQASNVAVLEPPPPQQAGDAGERPDAAPQTVSVPAGNVDTLRDVVCNALEAAGHNTAAVLLSSGNWIEADGAVRVEVRLKKTMLGLTMNAEADKIVKAAAREAGYSQAITVVSAADGSGDASGAGTTTPKRPPAAGSVQAEALAHPLVKQALELFNGEVRSVLNLREKRDA
jgi:DNA polymerase-3 subunit gamma/tau